MDPWSQEDPGQRLLSSPLYCRGSNSNDAIRLKREGLKGDNPFLGDAKNLLLRSSHCKEGLILFQEFIQQYGYYAVFFFACIEGEVAVLTAGFLCHRGLMSLDLVILFAFLGTFITEQGFFFFGRVYGVRLLQKHPKLAQKSEKIMRFLRKYDTIFIFCSRFIYGIRNFSPIAIGMTGIHPLKFSACNIPAAFIWSAIVAGAGYFFSNALESAKENMHVAEMLALGLVILVLGIYLYRKRRKKEK